MRKRFILMVLVAASAALSEFTMVREGLKFVIEIVKHIPDQVFGG